MPVASINSRVMRTASICESCCWCDACTCRTSSSKLVAFCCAQRRPSYCSTASRCTSVRPAVGPTGAEAAAAASQHGGKSGCMAVAKEVHARKSDRLGL